MCGFNINVMLIYSYGCAVAVLRQCLLAEKCISYALRQRKKRIKYKLSQKNFLNSKLIRGYDGWVA
jgi:hypothetical protein